MKIELANGECVEATYVTHLRTITPRNSGGGRNRDIDLYRLEDGREIVAWDNGDARDTPREMEGATKESVQWIE